MKWMLTSIILPVLCCGCTTFTGYPDRSENFEDELKYLQKYFDPNILSNYDKIPYDSDKKKIQRNEIINGRIRAIDLHFNYFQQSLYREGIGYNIATDWTVIGLNAAGALTSSLDTAQILAAISGGITGAKASVDKNAFFDRTMPAILSQMVARRKEKLITIRSGLIKDPTEYPLTMALTDLEDYYLAGTLPGAIIGITEGAGATIKEADKEIKQLQILPPEKITLKEKMTGAVASLSSSDISKGQTIVSTLDQNAQPATDLTELKRQLQRFIRNSRTLEAIDRTASVFKANGLIQ